LKGKDKPGGAGAPAQTTPPTSSITFGPPVITVSTESPPPFKFVEQGPTYRFGTIAKAQVNTQASYAEVIIQPGKSSMEFTAAQVLGKKVVVQEMSGIQALVNGTDIVDIPEKGEFTLPSNTITVRFFHKDKLPFGVATLY
jgi:hypothetical protein